MLRYLSNPVRVEIVDRLCESLPFLRHLLRKSSNLDLKGFKVIQGQRSWFQSIARAVSGFLSDIR